MIRNGRRDDWEQGDMRLAARIKRASWAHDRCFKTGGYQAAARGVAASEW